MKKDYYESKYMEMIKFKQDMKLCKTLAEQKIKERGEAIRAEIVRSTENEVKKNSDKIQKKMELVEKLEQASLEGNFELMNELVNEIKK